LIAELQSGAGKRASMLLATEVVARSTAPGQAAVEETAKHTHRQTHTLVGGLFNFAKKASGGLEKRVLCSGNQAISG
jgi:hypothetical protein